MSNVRTKSAIPVNSDFTSRDGSPVVMDTALGVAYMLKDDGTIWAITPLLAWSNKAPSADLTIPAAYSVYISGGYEIKPGYTLEIGAGAFMEIG